MEPVRLTAYELQKSVGVTLRRVNDIVMDERDCAYGGRAYGGGKRPRPHR